MKGAVEKLLVLLLCSQSVLGRPIKCSATRNFLRYYPDAPEAKKECIQCSECPEGEGLLPLCGSIITNYTRIECTSCKENETFSNTHDIGSCKTCQDCGLRNVIQQCTPFQNRICGTECPERHFLDDNSICQECYFCCPNVHESARITNCKDIGMGRDWQCWKTDQNRLCKEALENASTAAMQKVDIATTATSVLRRTHGYDLEANITTKSSWETSKSPGSKLVSTAGKDDAPTKEGNHQMTPTCIILITFLTTVLLIVVVAVIIFIWKKSTTRSGAGGSQECVPLKDMSRSEDIDDSGGAMQDDLAVNHEESTAMQLENNRPNTELIPTDCLVSEMLQLRDHENQLMLHYVQKMLDPVETRTRKTWRRVGLLLNVKKEDLDLIETDYKAGKSPTESLLETLESLPKEPSMIEFVQALHNCGRNEVANYICNWPWDNREQLGVAHQPA